ncbi:MAG TPA: hypothetical protein PK619_02655 [bacterium]|nr:hypothetical protein [bacterium]HPN81351.1 hypothetical protein [bacterium]HPW39596.1 hypothetical protein [bacterium]
MFNFDREADEHRHLTIRRLVDVVLQKGGNFGLALELLKKMDCGRSCPGSKKNPASWQNVSLAKMTEKDLVALLNGPPKQGVKIGGRLKCFFGQWVFADDLVYQRVVDKVFRRWRYWLF